MYCGSQQLCQWFWLVSEMLHKTICTQSNYVATFIRVDGAGMIPHLLKCVPQLPNLEFSWKLGKQSKATPICNLVLRIFKQKRVRREGEIISYFGDKNYEASDYTDTELPLWNNSQSLLDHCLLN